jgi:hypothetical protein
MSEKSLDARARRAARRAGLDARKSRRSMSIDNWGGYMLVDPFINVCVGGSLFNLSAEQIIEHCEELAEHESAA